MFYVSMTMIVCYCLVNDTILKMMQKVYSFCPSAYIVSYTQKMCIQIFAIQIKNRLLFSLKLIIRLSYYQIQNQNKHLLRQTVISFDIYPFFETHFFLLSVIMGYHMGLTGI